MALDAIILVGVVVLTAAGLIWTFWGSHHDDDGE